MANKFVVRSAFSYDRDLNSEGTAFFDDTESMTQQSFKEECDINTIVRRFGLTGEMPENVRVPQYADFEESFDFMSAMNLIREAQESFMSMPSAIRDRFGHDPSRFVDFFNDPENRPEAERLGVLTRRPVPPQPDPSPSAPVPVPGPSGPVPPVVPGAPSTTTT